MLTLEEIAKLPEGTNDGYKIRYLPKGHPQRTYSSATWRFEHDLVMESVIGRLLQRGEHVHHDNGNKVDNVPQNLVLTTRSEHGRIHNPLKGEWVACPACEKEHYRPRRFIRLGRGNYCCVKCGAESPGHIAARVNLTGRKTDKEVNAQVFAEKQAGKTWREIASNLGCSIGAVRDRHYVHVHGHSRRIKGGSNDGSRS